MTLMMRGQLGGEDGGKVWQVARVTRLSAFGILELARQCRVPSVATLEVDRGRVDDGGKDGRRVYVAPKRHRPHHHGVVDIMFTG
jgi:hypothetical protein